MSIPTGINGDAPVRAHHETDINAPLDTVWQLPAWQTDITAAHIDGPFQPGASFEWTSYGFTVVSTIYVLAERARVLSGGAADGITGVHEWVFSETPTGVHVTTTKSFAGEPVEADATGMQSALDNSLIACSPTLRPPPKPTADSGQLVVRKNVCFSLRAFVVAESFWRSMSAPMVPVSWRTEGKKPGLRASTTLRPGEGNPHYDWGRVDHGLSLLRPDIGGLVAHRGQLGGRPLRHNRAVARRAVWSPL